MAALLHLYAGEGWTLQPHCTNVDEASAILEVYRESALHCIVAKLHLKCTEISGQIGLAASFCEIAHWRLLAPEGWALCPCG